MSIVSAHSHSQWRVLGPVYVKINNTDTNCNCYDYRCRRHNKTSNNYYNLTFRFAAAETIKMSQINWLSIACSSIPANPVSTCNSTACYCDKQSRESAMNSRCFLVVKATRPSSVNASAIGCVRLSVRPLVCSLCNFWTSCNLPKLGLGRSLSRNRFWCILALKYDNWWQQFKWFSRNCTNYRNHNQNREDFSFSHPHWMGLMRCSINSTHLNPELARSR